MADRQYQTDAKQAVMSFVTKFTEPCIIEAATGAGKSHMISGIADELYTLSKGKGVLCLAPSAKLVKQNREKFLFNTKRPASIFSASAGSKCLRHPVIFATPMTVLNAIQNVVRAICAVIVDECHLTTPSIIEIINRLREINPNLRVIGLTATPYRTNEGYIYAIDVDGEPVPPELATKPYFKKLVYRITKAELEAMGYLTPALIMDTNADAYDLAGLPKNASEENLDRVYLGQGRKTAQICAELVDRCRDKQSIMIFAATVRHAQEVAASLPPGLTRVVGGKINMTKAARTKVEDDFKAGKIKYLVSVGTMTTGVDFPDVEVIALLRFTDSLNLLEQMIGRGARLGERKKKENFWLFDYAGNLETHYGEEVNLYEPTILAKLKKTEVINVPALCTSCGNINNFVARPNPDELRYDDEGYFLDLEGNQIKTEHGPIPGHFGRRCLHYVPVAGKLERCAHRWTEKLCYECGAANDIAAKYCSECRAEIVNPNDKLLTEFKKYKKDLSKIQCDKVLHITHGPSLDKKGTPCVVVNVETEYRKFTFWLFPNSDRRWLVGKYTQYMEAHAVGINTITYHKNGKSGFFEVHDYNKPHDEVRYV